MLSAIKKTKMFTADRVQLLHDRQLHGFWQVWYVYFPSKSWAQSSQCLWRQMVHISSSLWNHEYIFPVDVFYSAVFTVKQSFSKSCTTVYSSTSGMPNKLPQEYGNTQIYLEWIFICSFNANHYGSLTETERSCEAQISVCKITGPGTGITSH